jgi:hypothetical protein
MRENLYCRRYESFDDELDREAFLSSHKVYRETLKELYIRILKFQATSVCFYSNNRFLRVASDIVVWNNWDSLFQDIQEQEKEFSLVCDGLKDISDQEEFEALRRRHEKNIARMKYVGNDVSCLKVAVEDGQKDRQRESLLDWLSSLDASKNYRDALDKKSAETGGWLIQSKSFRRWKIPPNSLLWLHGKGETQNQGYRLAANSFTTGSGKSVLRYASTSLLDTLRL